MPAYDASRDKAARSHLETARQLVSVTKSDTVDLTTYARALWVGGAGDVAIVGPDGPDTAVVLKAVAAGTLLPVQARRVHSTGTTATDIVALI